MGDNAKQLDGDPTRQRSSSLSCRRRPVLTNYMHQNVTVEHSHNTLHHSNTSPQINISSLSPPAYTRQYGVPNSIPHRSGMSALSIDVEPVNAGNDPQQLMIGSMSRSYHSPGGEYMPDTPHSMPPMRSVENTEARGLAFQQDRMQRLETAHQKLKIYLHQIMDEEKVLLKELQQVQREKKSLDSTTEQEIQKMREANHKLGCEIQNSIRYLPNNMPITVHPTLPHSPLQIQRTPERTPSPAINHVYSPQYNIPVTQQRPPPPQIPTRPSQTPTRPIPSVPAGLPDDTDGESWECTACTYHNHPLLQTCEICERSRTPPDQ